MTGWIDELRKDFRNMFLRSKMVRLQDLYNRHEDETDIQWGLVQVVFMASAGTKYYLRLLCNDSISPIVFLEREKCRAVFGIGDFLKIDKTEFRHINISESNQVFEDYGMRHMFILKYQKMGERLKAPISPLLGASYKECLSLVQEYLEPVDETGENVHKTRFGRFMDNIIEEEEAEKIKAKGNELYQQKQFKEAIRVYSQALKKNTLDHNIWSNCSQAHLKCQEYAEAEDKALMALKLSPYHAKSLIRLIKSLLEQNLKHQAKRMGKAAQYLNHEETFYYVEKKFPEMDYSYDPEEISPYRIHRLGIAYSVKNPRATRKKCKHSSREDFLSLISDTDKKDATAILIMKNNSKKIFTFPNNSDFQEKLAAYANHHDGMATINRNIDEHFIELLDALAGPSRETTQEEADEDTEEETEIQQEEIEIQQETYMQQEQTKTQETYMQQEQTETQQYETYMQQEQTKTQQYETYMQQEQTETQQHETYMQQEQTETQQQETYMQQKQTETQQYETYMQQEQTETQQQEQTETQQQEQTETQQQETDMQHEQTKTQQREQTETQQQETDMQHTQTKTQQQEQTETQQKETDMQHTQTKTQQQETDMQHTQTKTQQQEQTETQKQETETQEVTVMQQEGKVHNEDIISNVDDVAVSKSINKEGERALNDEKKVDAEDEDLQYCDKQVTKEEKQETPELKYRNTGMNYNEKNKQECPGKVNTNSKKTRKRKNMKEDAKVETRGKNGNKNKRRNGPLRKGTLECSHDVLQPCLGDLQIKYEGVPLVPGENKHRLQTTSTNMARKYQENGARLFQEGSFLQALKDYERSLPLCHGEDVTERKVLQLVMSMCEIQCGKSLIQSGMERLNVCKDEVMLAPSVQYWFAVGFEKLCLFKTACDYAHKCIEHLQDSANNTVNNFPGTQKQIVDTKPSVLKYKCLQLIERIKGSNWTTKPLARCRMPGCLAIQESNYAKTNIYLQDPEFKGYTSVICDAQCTVAFHPCCWKAYKEKQDPENGRMSDKDFLAKQCMTPDCSGIICRIRLYDENNGLKCQVSKDKNEVSGNLSKEKLKRPKRESQPKTADKQQLHQDIQELDKNLSHHSNEADQTIYHGSNAEFNIVKPSSPTQQLPIDPQSPTHQLPIDPESLHHMNVTILKPSSKNDEESPKIPKKRKSKTKKTVSLDLMEEVLGSSQNPRNEYTTRLEVLKRQNNMEVMTKTQLKKAKQKYRMEQMMQEQDPQGQNKEKIPAKQELMNTSVSSYNSVDFIDSNNPFYIPEPFRSDPQKFNDYLLAQRFKGETAMEYRQRLNSSRANNSHSPLEILNFNSMEPVKMNREYMGLQETVNESDLLFEEKLLEGVDQYFELLEQMELEGVELEIV